MSAEMNRPLIDDDLHDDRFTRAFRAATETLGSKEKARRWLTTKNRALGGVAPIAVLDSDVGLESITDVLGRIAYGIFS
jgi:putative toxin-antitoxin system antitoxin component (TIGR02293 family)